MLETLINVGSGGLFGLIGAGFTKYMGWKQQKLQLEHDLKMAAEERQNIAMEMELAQIKGTIDLELQESENDAKALQSALAHDAAITGTSQWVADLRGSLRPILTYGLVICAVLMTSFLQNNPHNDSVLFLATTAVTFWFGSRPPSKK